MTRFVVCSIICKSISIELLACLSVWRLADAFQLDKKISTGGEIISSRFMQNVSQRTLLNSFNPVLLLCRTPFRLLAGVLPRSFARSFVRSLTLSLLLQSIGGQLHHGRIQETAKSLPVDNASATICHRCQEQNRFS